MPSNIDLVDDALLAMGFNADDAIMHRAAGMANLAMIIDRIKRQRLEKELMSGQGSRGATDVMTTYIVPIEQETYLNGRNYFDLPSNVYDIRLNGGLEYVTYGNRSNCDKALVGRRFTLASPGEMDMLDGAALQKPSPANPYYYRARLNNGTETFTDRVWLAGPGPTVESLEVGLYLTMGDIEDIDPLAEVDLPADMVYLVKRAMLDLGRWCLLIPQQRTKNDGRDFPVNQQPLQPPPGISVNDQLNLTSE